MERKINGQIRLYFGKIQENRNSSEQLLTQIGLIFHNYENKFKTLILSQSKYSKSKVHTLLDASY